MQKVVGSNPITRSLHLSAFEPTKPRLSPLRRGFSFGWAVALVRGDLQGQCYSSEGVASAPRFSGLVYGGEDGGNHHSVWRVRPDNDGRLNVSTTARGPEDR